VTDQAKTNLGLAVNLNAYEAMSFSENDAETLRQELLNRKNAVSRIFIQLSQAIETGEISLDSATSLATEQTLLKCLMSIAISANTEMLPVLHPGYHTHASPLMQQKCRDLVRNSRQIRRRR
jgi:hypothetical protein